MKVCQSCYTEVEDHIRFCPNCGSQIGEDDTDADGGLIGRIVAGKFLIKEEIGSGAMGCIYKAEQVPLGKDVCIKVMHQHLLGDHTLSKRFHREARAVSLLKHPNCINIIDFGVTDDHIHYIAMDYLEGRNLGSIIRTDAPLEALRVVAIAEQICAALDEAHAQGIIHRDLKPDNVMLEDRRRQKDFVTVLDFGIAKIKDRSGENETFATMAGMVCGTPEYMSPEQGRGDALDARTDLYALGVIMYQMTTGRVPFTAESPIGIVTKHLTETPVRPAQHNPQLHPLLEDLIIRLLAKDRGERPPTAIALKQELERIRGVLEKGAELGFETTATLSRPAPAISSTMDLATSPTLQVATDSLQPGSPTGRGSSRGKLALLIGVPLVVVTLVVLAILFVRPKEQSEQPPVIAASVETPAVDNKAALPVNQSADLKAEVDAGTTQPPETPDLRAEDVKAEPEVVQVDPVQVLRKSQEARVLELSRTLNNTRGELAARHLTLENLGATNLSQDTGRALARLAMIESRIQKTETRLLEAPVSDEDLASLTADVDNSRTEVLALLALPIPTAEELARKRISEKLWEQYGQQVAQSEIELKSTVESLKEKSLAWSNISRQDKVGEIEATREQTEALRQKYHELSLKMHEGDAEDFGLELEQLGPKRKTLEARVNVILGETLQEAPKQDEGRDDSRKDSSKSNRHNQESKATSDIKKDNSSKDKGEASHKTEDAAAEAKNLVQSGDEAYSEGRYAAAIGMYKQALRVRDSAETHLKIGKAYNSVNDYPNGAKHLKIYLNRMAGKLPDYKVELIKKQIRE